MFNRLFTVLVALMWLVPACSGKAAPLVYVWMEGRVAGTEDPYSTIVGVQAGQAVEYRIMLQMAPVGTTNEHYVNNVYHKATITSLLRQESPDGPMGDGFNALWFDIYQNPLDPIQASLSPLTLNDDPTPMEDDTWNGLMARGSRELRKSVDGIDVYDLLNILPRHWPGVWTGVDREVVAFGKFSVPLAVEGEMSTVRMRWYPIGTAGSVLFINNHDVSSICAVTAASERSIDPLVGFFPPPDYYPQQAADWAGADSGGLLHAQPRPEGLGLVLVPEPGVFMLLLLPAAALLRRRQRQLL